MTKTKTPNKNSRTAALPLLEPATKYGLSGLMKHLLDVYFSEEKDGTLAKAFTYTQGPFIDAFESGLILHTYHPNELHFSFNGFRGLIKKCYPEYLDYLTDKRDYGDIMKVFKNAGGTLTDSDMERLHDLDDLLDDSEIIFVPG